MNFAYGIIAAVGVLVAISLVLISASPSDIIEPRAVSEEKLTVCTTEWVPVCGIDGETYSNLCMLNAADVKLAHKFECGIDDPIVKPRVQPEDLVEPEPEVMEEVMEPEVMEEVMEPEVMEEVMEPEVMEEETLPMSLTISIPDGVGVPGCETTQECYLPYEVTVAAGATVTWTNDDTVVHTVTSGSPTAGVTGLFDSSIFNAGDSYEHTFDDAGTYDYFCMVHPWMEGIVHVN